jgi:para-aminobenzoate synthetase/4-amino-4-deoxychorismate lyase
VINIHDIFKTLEKKNYSAFFFTPPIYKNSKSYLFNKPKQIIKINSSNYLKNFNKVDDLIKNHFGYCWINYQAGYLFEKKLFHFVSSSELLAEFVFFDKNNFETFKSDKINFDFTSDYKIKNFRLNTSKKDYSESIEKIKSFIKQGDTYQVNYTVKGKFCFTGSLSSLFQQLIFNQSAKYICIINLPDRFVISISPELFFEYKKNRINTKPMKGTTYRGVDIPKDILSKQEFSISEKDIAENVMIVDLLRNDLGRISKLGSVKVKNLFEVEKYESLFQMTSEISSTLSKGTKLSDIIKNMFPCGSVTGAPKIRTMEIIHQIEKEKRNIYTGSIGLLLKDKITMNVAIRTLSIDKFNGNGEIGLGSGIVWDSDPEKEFNEVLLKSKFLTSSQMIFEIFENVLVKNSEIVFIDEHINKLKSTADYFLFKFDEKLLRKKLKYFLSKVNNSVYYNLKIMLSKYGSITFKVSELKTTADKIKVILSKSIIDSQNKFQYFKTTNRNLYDTEYNKFSAKGFYDVIYLNEKYQVAEGSISNIFIKKGIKYLTPPISCGISADVYRSFMMQKNSNIIEKILTVQHLIDSDEIILTNCIDGEVKVDELYFNESEYISFEKKIF